MKLLLLISLIVISTNSKGQHIDGDTSINLAGLELTKIPDSVFSKKHLFHLDLGTTGFTLYPPLSALANGNNLLTILPNEIGRLKKLKTLRLSFNKLKELPDSISLLQDLQFLDVSFNEGLDINNEIDKIKKLSKLNTLLIIGTKNAVDAALKIKKLFPDNILIIATVKELIKKEK